MLTITEEDIECLVNGRAEFQLQYWFHDVFEFNIPLVSAGSHQNFRAYDQSADTVNALFEHRNAGKPKNCVFVKHLFDGLVHVKGGDNRTGRHLIFDHDVS